MPRYWVRKVQEALNDDAKALRGSRVLVLGVAYKKNVSDVRESPALDVIDLLRHKGADVVYTDPHVTSIKLEGGHIMENCEYSLQLLQEADCVVVITDHSTFDWAEVLENSAIVVDTRNALKDVRGNSAKVVTL